MVNILIYNKTLKQLQLPLIILLAASIPFPIKVHNIIVFLFLAITLLTINWTYFRKDDFIKTPLILLILLQFLLISAGLIHTTDLYAGLGDLERNLYPVVLIFLIYQIRSWDTSINTILAAFTSGCITLTLYGFIYAGITLDLEAFTELLVSGHRQYTSFVFIQPLYLSVYFILIFFYLIETLRTQRNTLSTSMKYLISVLMVFALCMVFFLRSKTGLIVLPTLLLIYMVVLLKKRGWFIAFALFTVGLLTFLLTRNEATGILDEYGRTVSTAFDQRISIWRGALEGIKESPLLGAGTGGDQNLLNTGYERIGYQQGVDNSFNAHNQYLQFVVRNGLLELICFLALLSYSFWRSSKSSNYTFLMFNMLVALVMFTESFLSVQKGIVFFYLMLLSFHYLPQEVEKPQSR